MKWFLVFVILLSLLISIGVYSGVITVYEPLTENIHITVSEINTGNHLIDISEVNIILLLMVAGVFIVTR